MKIQLSTLISVLITVSALTCGYSAFCTEVDPLCLACDPLSRICIECANGYLGLGNKCQAVTSAVDFCFSYKSEGQCRVCQYGYYLTEHGTCLEIEDDDDCIIYDIDTKQCTVCKDSKVPNEEGQCKGDTECNIPNCQYCLVRGQTPNCIECDKSYSMVYQSGIASCIKETPSVSNCNTLYTHDNLKCFICDAPFYNLNGSCLHSEEYNLSKSQSIWKVMFMWITVAVMAINWTA